MLPRACGQKMVKKENGGLQKCLGSVKKCLGSVQANYIHDVQETVSRPGHCLKWREGLEEVNWFCDSVFLWSLHETAVVGRVYHSCCIVRMQEKLTFVDVHTMEIEGSGHQEEGTIILVNVRSWLASLLWSTGGQTLNSFMVSLCSVERCSCVQTGS